MASTGTTPMEVSQILWPDANLQTRRVLIARWMTKPVVSIRLDQLKALSEYFGETDINNLIEP
jgi:hypothetical protein